MTPTLKPAWLGLALLLLGCCGAAAQPVAQTTRPLLRVVTGHDAPFVQQPGTPVSGFSIEVWHEVARRLGVDTAWTVLPDLSDEQQIAAVAQGQADLAVSSLSVTAARAARVDFSLPYVDSGLQVMVAAKDAHPLDAAWSALTSAPVRNLLGIGLLVVVLLAHLLWLVERRHDADFQGGYRRGILEALWGVMLIIATGEHGDRRTPRVMKRLTVSAMWLLGAVLIAQFTATVAAALTVNQLRTDIRGPEDLPGHVIATAPGSIAAAWLQQRQLPFIAIDDTERAYAMLLRGEIQAIVYEAPQLRHWLAGRGTAMAQLVGPVFRPERYAIAVPLGSPLRRQIDAALLAMQEDGSLEAISRRWFGM